MVSLPQFLLDSLLTCNRQELFVKNSLSPLINRFQWVKSRSDVLCTQSPVTIACEFHATLLVDGVTVVTLTMVHAYDGLIWAKSWHYRSFVNSAATPCSSSNIKSSRHLVKRRPHSVTITVSHLFPSSSYHRSEARVGRPDGLNL